MSKVLDASAAPSPASEPATVADPVIAAQEPALFDMDSMSKAERQKLIAKGVFPKKIEKVEPKPAESAPAKLKSAAGDEPSPSAGTASDSDPEDEETLSPQERRKRNRNLRTEVTRLAAENKLLKEQQAEHRKPAPVAAKDPEPAKPAETAKKPRIKDYPATDEGTAKWEDDLEDYFRKLTESTIEARLTKDKSAAQTAKAGESWNSQVTAAKAEHDDWEAIADNAIISPVGLDAVSKHPKGAWLLYQLGLPANAEEARRIAAATDIDGLDYKALAAASKKPEIRDRILRALGRAETELDRLAAKLETPPAEDPAPKPVLKKITSAATPPRPAGGNAAAEADPLTAAFARGKKSGNMTEFNRIYDERTRAHLRG